MLALIFLILAIACAAYGACVMGLQSGTPFFAVWFGLAAVFALLAAATHFGWIGKLPFALRCVGLTAAALLVALCGVETVLIAGAAGQKADAGLEYVIVLGAQVRPDHQLSLSLQYRLDAAADYLASNPGAVAIVSGGQGFNEPCTEAQAMEEYLVAHGVSAERVIQEPWATNTTQNIAFSKRIIAERVDGALDGALGDAQGGASELPAVGVVTNDFHLFRGVALARKQGIRVQGIAAASTPFFLPNNVLREFFGITKDFLVGNL